MALQALPNLICSLRPANGALATPAVRIPASPARGTAVSATGRARRRPAPAPESSRAGHRPRTRCWRPEPALSGASKRSRENLFLIDGDGAAHSSPSATVEPSRTAFRQHRPPVLNWNFAGCSASPLAVRNAGSVLKRQPTRRAVRARSRIPSSAHRPSGRCRSLHWIWNGGGSFGLPVPTAGWSEMRLYLAHIPGAALRRNAIHRQRHSVPRRPVTTTGSEWVSASWVRFRRLQQQAFCARGGHDCQFALPARWICPDQDSW